MIKSSEIHISSKNPERLAIFYRDILCRRMAGDGPDFDGVSFEGENGNPTVWIWDEKKHGKKNEGPVFLTIDCPDPDRTYHNLKQKGVELDPPKVVSWSGKGLYVTDPDGNTIMLTR